MGRGVVLGLFSRSKVVGAHSGFGVFLEVGLPHQARQRAVGDVKAVGFLEELL